MKNLNNKKYILQETRSLKDNEFVFTRTECACKDAMFWKHLIESHGVSYEDIDDTTLPDDANGERMWGIRVMGSKDV
jgi:hypothetical protein